MVGFLWRLAASAFMVIGARLNDVVTAALFAAVLAAGEGSRMHSQRPKPLHRLCGRPMILYVLDALGELPLDRVVAVVGRDGEWVTKTLGDQAPPHLDLELVEQREPRGTGDALAAALSALPVLEADDDADVVVVPGDTPLVEASTIASLVRHHRNTEAVATVLTAFVGDPTGYDRVLRGKDGRIERVVYDAEADAQARRKAAQMAGSDRRAWSGIGIGHERRLFDAALDASDSQGFEVATSIHCFRYSVLAPALRRLEPVGPRAEHSLTGLYAVLRGAGYKVESLTVADPAEAIGVNDRVQLAQAEGELRRRINERAMRKGVTMWDPARTYVDADVELEADVVLLPGTMLKGRSKVAVGAEIGPDSHLIDTEVGARATVVRSDAQRAVIGPGAKVGPFVVLEPGAVVDTGAVVPPFSVVSGST